MKFDAPLFDNWCFLQNYQRMTINTRKQWNFCACDWRTTTNWSLYCAWYTSHSIHRIHGFTHAFLCVFSYFTWYYTPKHKKLFTFYIWNILTSARKISVGAQQTTHANVTKIIQVNSIRKAFKNSEQKFSPFNRNIIIPYLVSDHLAIEKVTPCLISIHEPGTYGLYSSYR